MLTMRIARIYPVADHAHGAVLRPARHRVDGRSFSAGDLTTTPTPVHKRAKVGRWRAGAQSHDRCKYLHVTAAHQACVRIATLRAIAPMATFLPTECLPAPALCLCRTGSGRNESHATPRSPFLMPSGDPGLVCPRSRSLSTGPGTAVQSTAS